MDSSGLTFLGEVFLSKDEKIVDPSAIYSARIVGIYFSAHWCPPCRNFTPKLAEFYNEVNSEEKQFEVVFVSSDKDEKSFKDYHNEMPWLALPFGDPIVAEIKQKYQVRGIPTLVLLRPDGTTIDVDSRNDVTAGPQSFKKWLEKL
jgi:nucleoredoxin